MSWEGYSQNFCKNGHFFEGPAGFAQEPKECRFCEAAIVVQNIVDETNYEAVGVIDEEVLNSWIVSHEVVETCNLGHSHVTSRAVFKIPTEEELEASRGWWDVQESKFKKFGE